MSFLAPAVPWIAQGAGALLGGLFGKKAQSNAMQRSDEEKVGLGGEQGVGKELSTTGSQMTQMGTPAIQSGLNYWQTLLGGNRTAQALATAGPRASLTDTYRGAGKSLEQAGVRGATKDRLTGELARDKASSIAGLVTGVQPAAAQQLGALGLSTAAQGAGRTEASGNVFSDLLGQGYKNRVYARGEGEKTASSAGGLFSGLLGSIFKRKPKDANSGMTSPYGGGGAWDQGPTQSMLG